MGDGDGGVLADAGAEQIAEHQKHDQPGEGAGGQAAPHPGEQQDDGRSSDGDPHDQGRQVDDRRSVGRGGAGRLGEPPGHVEGPAEEA